MASFGPGRKGWGWAYTGGEPTERQATSLCLLAMSRGRSSDAGPRAAFCGNCARMTGPLPFPAKFGAELATPAGMAHGRTNAAFSVAPDGCMVAERAVFTLCRRGIYGYDTLWRVGRVGGDSLRGATAWPWCCSSNRGGLARAGPGCGRHAVRPILPAGGWNTASRRAGRALFPTNRADPSWRDALADEPSDSGRRPALKLDEPPAGHHHLLVSLGWAAIL